jgi:hypothetical protein
MAILESTQMDVDLVNILKVTNQALESNQVYVEELKDQLETAN